MTLRIGADEVEKIADTIFFWLFIDQHLLWDKQFNMTQSRSWFICTISKHIL